MPEVPVSPGAGVSPGPRAALPSMLSGVLLPAAGVLLGVNLLRVYLPGVLFVVGKSLTFEQMGLFALATFLSIFLAPVGVRLLGTRRFLALAAGGLAAVRLAEQIARSPWWDVGFSTAGVVLLLWFFPAYVAWRRAQGGDLRLLALGLALGLSLETAVRGAAITYDLSWQAGAGALLAVALLCALLVGSLLYQLAPSPGAGVGPGAGPGAAWPLLAVGPYVFLELEVFRNLGAVQVLGGLSYPAGFAWLHLSSVLLLVWLWARSGPWLAGSARGRRAGEALVAGAVLLAALWELGPGPARAALPLLLVGQVAAGALLWGAVSGAAAGRRGGRGWDSLFLGFGFVFLMGLVFYYYSEYTLVPVVFPLAGAALALISLAAAGRAPAPAPIRPAAAGALALAVLLGLVPLWTWLSFRAPQPVAAPPGTRQLTIMTYNIQMGFDAGGRMNLAEQARTIAAAEPDVVALQEVQRGWAVDSAVDTVGWLSWRLGLPYVYAPFSGDLWGQAILSRYPLEDVRAVPFPDSGGDVGEGLLAATAAVDGQRIHLIASHFSAPIGGRGSERVAQVRLQQAKMALDLWGQRPHTVILGDLNATPEAPEIQTILAAGFTDPVGALLPGAATSPAPDPRRRIDLILVSPDLSPTRASIPTSTASDHRPAVVTVGW